MDLVNNTFIARWIIAFALTLVLIVACAFVAQKYKHRLQKIGPKKNDSSLLKLRETLYIDAKNKVVLLDIAGKDVAVLIGPNNQVPLTEITNGKTHD